jgi:hypothetical protein|tara:strand:+ start:929 stop:1507 length:579 start_codon:yes stop_codon:yes gene_type:complete
MGRKRIYYPEGSIQKGLYTSGAEWMFEDGTEYIGQYHRYLNTKEVFTESYYIKDVSKKLIRYYNLNNQFELNTIQYNTLKEVVEDYTEILDIPDPYVPQPTQEDYDNSFVKRYFAKRKGSTTIFELSEEGFGELETPYYQKLELKWKISGPLNDTSEESGIIDTNRRTIQLYQNAFLGLERYLTNLTELAKI